MSDDFYQLVPARLAEERARLGLTQAQAAKTCGVSRDAWGKYERGEIAPGSPVLFRFAAAGADVQYLMLGQRSAPLSAREAALLDNFRHCDEIGQSAMLTTGAALAQPKKLKNAG